MDELRTKDKYLPKVADFYYGKSIFITGAAGFLGSVILQTLLRCCPGIGSIYILLRSKKGVQPEDRRDQIFNKKIFGRLKEENRKMLDKVQVIQGDITLSNIGMSEKDTQLLIEEVSIIFHCAASTNFHKPVKFALLSNVVSLNSIIEMSKRMKKFEVLVYTSTAYCNSNYKDLILEEEIYRLPFRAQKFLDALKSENDGKLQEIFDHCKPDWPNTYVFSKCVAENLILDVASDLPIAIIRPSLIFSTWKHPMPGYEEGKSGHGVFFIGAGRGFCKVMYADPNSKMDFVPVDVVANAHILAACSIATKKCPSQMVVHCTGTPKLIVRTIDFAKSIIQLALKHPFPLSFMKPSNCIAVPNKYLYHILVAYHHYLPAVVLDVMLKILGNKPWVYSTYRFIDEVANAGSFFILNSFRFKRDNLENLDKLIHPDDRKDLTLDFRDLTLSTLISEIPGVALFYDWKTDNKSQSERCKSQYMCYMIVNGIKLVFITSLMYFLFGYFFYFFVTAFQPIRM